MQHRRGEDSLLCYNMMMKHNSKLILLNASPLGDHVLLLDLAERFYISGQIKTVMFIKHNFKFLSELSAGYREHVRCIDFNTMYGKFYFVFMYIHSILNKNYLVYFLPIPYKKYLLYTGNLFHYLTRCVVLSQEYKDMEAYIPKGIHIQASIHTKYYYEQSNDILERLGFDRVESVPQFKCIQDIGRIEPYGLLEGATKDIPKKYIVVHGTPSHIERRIKKEIWSEVFAYAQEKHYRIVFTGIKKDEGYIDQLARGLPPQDFVKVIDADAQSLVNIFYFAEELFMVHTGPAHIAAALGKKLTVFCHLWLRQFDFSFNTNATVKILSRVDLVEGRLVEMKD